MVNIKHGKINQFGSDYAYLHVAYIYRKMEQFLLGH